jgi:hypothetical protein
MRSERLQADFIKFCFVYWMTWLTCKVHFIFTFLTFRCYQWPPLWSSGQSSWLHNGDVLCFLWGTKWIYICYVEESRPPLWSSGQSSWLQNQRPGFDSLRYQISWEAVSLERGPLSLVSTIEELLVRKSSGSGLESQEYGNRIRDSEHMAPSIRTSWQSLRREAAVARSV